MDYYINNLCLLDLIYQIILYLQFYDNFQINPFMDFYHLLFYINPIYVKDLNYYYILILLLNHLLNFFILLFHLSNIYNILYLLLVKMVLILHYYFFMDYLFL